MPIAYQTFPRSFFPPPSLGLSEEPHVPHPRVVSGPATSSEQFRGPFCSFQARSSRSVYSIGQCLTSSTSSSLVGDARARDRFGPTWRHGSVFVAVS